MIGRGTDSRPGCRRSGWLAAGMLLGRQLGKHLEVARAIAPAVAAVAIVIICSYAVAANQERIAVVGGWVIAAVLPVMLEMPGPIGYLLVGAVAGGQAGKIAGLMARLLGQGQAPSGLAIAASRRFRQMHQLRSAPEGPDVAANRLRPPLGGPRRQKVLEDLRRWPMPRAGSMSTRPPCATRASTTSGRWAT